jgi:threonine dehydrogenase-like Zn-dependent dehydrogenase
MKRLMRLMVTSRVDPRLPTTHRFNFNDVESAFRLMQTEENGILKPLIQF